MKRLLLLYMSLQFIAIGQARVLSDTLHRLQPTMRHADTVQVYGMQALFRFAHTGSDSLSLGFLASLPSATAALPDEALTFTPMLVDEEHRVALPPIRVNGHRQKSYYPRTRVLDYMQRTPSPYTVINCTASDRRKRVGDSIHINYLHRLPWAAWMASASLRLVATGHNGRQQYPSDSVMLCGNLRLPASPSVDTVYLYRDTCRQHTVTIVPDTVTIASDTVVRPISNYLLQEKADTLQEMSLDTLTDGYGSLTFRLWFRQGQQQVPALYGNEKEIERLRLALRQLGNRLTQINIHSCSSPEGTYYRNQQITRARGLLVKQHLYRVLSAFPIHKVQLSESPENWEELERMLQQSSKPYRDRALHIIRNVPIFSYRESRLMELQRGDPYRDMLADYFPYLRYVDITLVCDDENSKKQTHEVESIHSVQP